MLAEIHQVGVNTKTVKRSFENTINQLGPELFVLEETPIDEIKKKGSELLAEGILRMRKGQVHRTAGYDGEYGTIRLFKEKDIA